MSQELTTSLEARENILNNKLTLTELKNALHLYSVSAFNKEEMAQILGIETNIIDIYIEQNSEELYSNGYQPSSADNLYSGTFSFRAFINLVMLVRESEKAKEIRSLILDVAIGVMARMQGGYADFSQQNFSTLDSAPLLELADRTEVALQGDVGIFLKQQSEALQEQIQEPNTLAVFKRLRDR